MTRQVGSMARWGFAVAAALVALQVSAGKAYADPGLTISPKATLIGTSQVQVTGTTTCTAGGVMNLHMEITQKQNGGKLVAFTAAGFGGVAADGTPQPFSVISNPNALGFKSGQANVWAIVDCFRLETACYWDEYQGQEVCFDYYAYDGSVITSTSVHLGR